MDFSIDAQIAPRLRLGVVSVEPVAIGPAAPPLVDEIEQLRARLVREHTGRAPAEIPGIQQARELYRSFGIDPTRTRPSSEALLRRIIALKPFPHISNAVDLCNLAAVHTLLPLGLYDAGKIHGKVTARLGASGESYEGIRKPVVHLEGRLTLADENGPFGNPTSDSLRTSVTGEARSLCVVIFAPPSLEAAIFHEHVCWMAESYERHLGTVSSSFTLPQDLLRETYSQ